MQLPARISVVDIAASIAAIAMVSVIVSPQATAPAPVDEAVASVIAFAPPGTNPRITKIVPEFPAVSLQRLVTEELNSLPMGNLVFAVPTRMKQGTAYQVTLRVGTAELRELADGLSKADVRLRERVRVAAVMTARLIPEAEGRFRVTPLSQEEQFVADPYSEWVWNAEPLDWGRQKLNLVVSVKLTLPGGQDRSRTYPVKSQEIDVDVSIPYAIKNSAGPVWAGVSPVLYPSLTALLAWIAGRAWQKRQTERESRIVKP